MHLRTPTVLQTTACLVAAFGFWAAVFAFHLINFWLGLSLAALILAGLSVIFAGLPFARRELNPRNTLTALLSAAVLYGLFYVCRNIAVEVFSFAPAQIGGIYTIREEASPLLIVPVLLFITSPCEELFWRGFVQRFGVVRFGPRNGWLFASLLYAAVHISSGNFMLVGAALVAGLFWGYVYLRTQSIYICILSHAVWTVAVFLVFPLHGGAG